MQAVPIVCQVCGAALSPENRSFFRRNAICEEHARADSVPDPQGSSARLRFCQQCTRLHLLGQFDGNHRSCRASLSKRRNRKRPGGAPYSGKRSTLYARCGRGMARGSESEGSADGEEAEVQAQQSHKHQHLRQKLQRAQHLMRREASGISSQHSDSSAPPAAVVAGPGSSSAGTGVELAAQCVVQQAAAEPSMRLALPGSLASSLAVAPVSVADFQALASTTDVRHLTCILAALSGPKNSAPPPSQPSSPRSVNTTFFASGELPMLQLSGAALGQQIPSVEGLDPAAALLFLQQLAEAQQQLVQASVQRHQGELQAAQARLALMIQMLAPSVASQGAAAELLLREPQQAASAADAAQAFLSPAFTPLQHNTHRLTKPQAVEPMAVDDSFGQEPRAPTLDLLGLLLDAAQTLPSPSQP
ncbi:hypothetical protein D9Q98_008402 [Chlorella vulgaris]|uniref:SBP-type domain-containing protein n=1 Tax=Chlorella vulgaris TaxID=3077 RepID=A0A9D4YTI6_CHLVU|nr:hypothetical protein D9Q98_008402 [Chlorella vulgaris]